MLEFHEKTPSLAMDADDNQPSSIARDKFAYEPPLCKVLVISDDPRCLSALNTAFRRMSRIEAKVTTAGTVTAAVFALACDDFDVVVPVGGHNLALDLITLTHASHHVVAVATSGPENEAFRRAGVPTILQQAITPARLQSLISLSRAAIPLQAHGKPRVSVACG